eukprot:m.149920 g.149920  ORF g.149920 m.149920 type:complete len:418 (+) comp14213_c0_seq1:202-1455(+)
MQCLSTTLCLTFAICSIPLQLTVMVTRRELQTPQTKVPGNDGNDLSQQQASAPPPPGKIGWPVVGDHTLAFYRDTAQFLESNTTRFGPVFRTRILNKPTVMVTSYSGVKACVSTPLLERATAFKPFMARLFGEDNLMLQGDEDRRSQAMALHCVFGCDNLHTFSDTLDAALRVATNHFKTTLEKQHQLDIYSSMKQFCTTMTLALFLGVSEHDTELIERISGVATTHWHGITALPIPFNVFGHKSTFDKALSAKEELLAIIRERIELTQRSTPVPPEQQVLAQIAKSLGQDDERTLNNMLIFVSALIPKALGALLSHLMIRLFRVGNESLLEKARSDSDFLFRCIQEVERLDPPILAGRRVVVPVSRTCFITPELRSLSRFVIIFHCSAASQQHAFVFLLVCQFKKYTPCVVVIVAM